VKGNKVEYKIDVENLSGDIAAAHFHAGDFGSTGSVFYTFDAVEPAANSNEWKGEIVVSDEIAALFAEAGVYINIHTALNPAGEIRAQVTPDTDTEYENKLNGDESVPSVDTMGKGDVDVVIDSVTGIVVYSVEVEKLNSGITSASFYNGAMGESGSSFVDIDTSAINTMMEGMASGSFVATADQLQLFMDEMVYVSVNTDASPSGEVRAQIVMKGKGGKGGGKGGKGGKGGGKGGKRLRSR
jgi:hypothetical protein